MKWSRAKEGYLQIDHRASPGTPLIPGGMNYESATATCSHCSIPITLDPRRTKPKEYCAACDGYICSVCSLAKKQPGYIHMGINQLLHDQSELEYQIIQNRKI
jgi:hypothetical protein